MKGFSVYYIEALVVCILLLLILLVHNHNNMDRQEKQIKFDRALIAFILYFSADCFWAAFEDGMIPPSRTGVIFVDLALYVFMAAICYFWLEYVMAVEQLPNRNRPINRFAVLFPFLLSTTALIIGYFAAPHLLIDEALETQPFYSACLIASPAVYLGAIMFYALKKAAGEDNPAEKRRHIFIGLFPLTTVAAGIIQEAMFPYMPIYCFVDALLIVIFYIQSIEARVSIDPLTGLNNRGELKRYVSQKNNLFQDGRMTVVMMMDINSFKMINDTYGHAEGDRALVIIAGALKQTLRALSMPSFLGRYGGDEFILVIHPSYETGLDLLMKEIRERIHAEIRKHETPYALTLSIGYDEMKRKDDRIEDCIRRADTKLYLDKKTSRLKRNLPL